MQGQVLFEVKNMPSWANHFRIADKLLPLINTLDKEYFIIGNIAPDCGIQVKAHGRYEPPTGATHFTSEYDYSKKTDCNYNYIFENFVKGEMDLKKRSFFIGYYVHLFTDCYYANELFVPIERNHGDFRYNEELSKTVKRERNNIDFDFFKNAISPSFELFKSFSPFEETYPEWYKNGEIAAKMKVICDFYERSEPTETEYKYITPKVMTQFVENTVGLVLNDMKQKGIEL